MGGHFRGPPGYTLVKNGAGFTLIDPSGEVWKFDGSGFGATKSGESLTGPNANGNGKTLEGLDPDGPDNSYARLSTRKLVRGGGGTTGPKPFHVLVRRETTEDGLLKGRISVNGQEIGTCYENAKKMIPAGTYTGVLRYSSAKDLVQGPGGSLGKVGDFLLEVADVPNRKDILFHAGNKPAQSDGCVMLGPAPMDPKTTDPIASEPLMKLRLLFYDGNDRPTGTPHKVITIQVRDP